MKDIKMYWRDETAVEEKGNPLTKEQNKLFQWVARLLSKNEKEMSDHEKKIQKIYTRLIIF